MELIHRIASVREYWWTVPAAVILGVEWLKGFWDAIRLEGYLFLFGMFFFWMFSRVLGKDFAALHRRLSDIEDLLRRRLGEQDRAMMTSRYRCFVLVGVLGLFVIAGCATQPAPRAVDLPGFWLALVHGLTAPFALIGSLFMDVRIYAFPNSGLLYDLGYLLGLSAWGGGASQL
ncbi:MAG TPA: hypothetical protein VI337_03600 [Nitrospirales bacterium]|nr:hypothetical protein [Nitrospirales bacterium]